MIKKLFTFLIFFFLAVETFAAGTSSSDKKPSYKNAVKIIEDKIPTFIAPFAIGTTFGLASSPCITPVLATLLAWVSQAKNPTIAIIFLFFFGIGQVTPLIIAGATAENLKKFLELRKFSQIIPTLSGIFLVALGLLNLFSNWI